MNGKTVGALLAAMIAAPALAGDNTDTVTLTGTVRDFQISHPDFESYPNTSKMGIVASTLDAEGKPALHAKSYMWESAVTSRDTFAQWYRDVPGVNITIPYSITLEPHPDREGVYYFAREKQMAAPHNYFFPIDTLGFGLSKETRSKPFIYYNDGSTANHNFHFTYELRTLFTFTPRDQRDHDLEFTFVGDDDVWVYINGQLVVDLGGVHSQEKGTYNIDTGKFKRYPAGGEAKTYDVDLELEPGKTYELALFFAERCTTESNFRIETTMNLTQPGALYD